MQVADVVVASETLRRRYVVQRAARRGCWDAAGPC
jgi:hypothetical protein